MRWKKYIVEATVEKEEEVCAVLAEHGITALEIQDEIIVPEAIEKEGGWFEELMPDVHGDQTAYVIFYVEEEEAASFSGELDRIRGDLAPLAIREEISDEADWRDQWKQYFYAFSIGGIYICPTWEEPDELGQDQTLIRIDPGIAFGTGRHESTRGAIELMQRYLKSGDAVLDVGCGSGILSVIARKLGAGKVRGTDIAAECLDAVADNYQINGLENPGGAFLIGDLSGDEALLAQVGEGEYDIVLANILADIIIGMSHSLFRVTRPGGILICAGIIDFKEESVCRALAQEGFELLESIRLGEWIALAARRRGEAL